MTTGIRFNRLWPMMLALSCALFLAPAALAGPGDPVEQVRESADRVMQLLRDNEERLSNDSNFVYELVEEEILPLVDFEGMSRLILGRHWRTASPEQRERFVEAFRDTMVRAYAGQLAEHADKRITVNERRSRTDGNRATVATEIVVGQGRPNIPVVYDLRIVDGQWKAFNLTVESWSLVTNFRTSFGAEIEGARTEAEGLESLIQRLERRDRDLVEGAVGS
ncbi:MlaC/ttg2D family ABC transporter substrate-binding protein [Thioalkalivibrio thiocyanodenitrificans]|uniref:MlaC/ttg2D family ABC transporter substrate-binding protein n=1 Tax=Thioalkalivibrio thiocyanodenitrificans TaxID=243063 RepID=UPI00036AF3A7|nr:ABC transporter substrate-binding protein [Thioalkalivibrio thiocyanodenitrificans]